MANLKWRTAKARCPFFLRSNNNVITCSTTMGNGDEIRRRLPTMEACTDWFRRYCSCRYSLCPISRIINDIVEEGTEDG